MARGKSSKDAKELIDEFEGMIEVLGFLEFLDSLREQDGKGEDWHSHECPNKSCGLVWNHDRNKLGKDEDAYDKAHTCPKCGTKTREKYWGDKAATCFFDGIELKEVA